jgi:hypothetical protein
MLKLEILPDSATLKPKAKAKKPELWYSRKEHHD